MNVYDSIVKGGKRWPKRPREELNNAVLEYLFDGTEPNLDDMNQYSAGAFEMLQPVLENQRKQRTRAQKPRPRKKLAKAQPNASQTLAETQPESNQTLAIKTIPYSYSSITGEGEYQGESSSEVDLLVGSGFVPPTVDEVRVFCSTNMLDKCDPEIFCAHYAAQGWVLGNGLPMVNWQAVARKWHMQDRNKIASSNSASRIDNFSDLNEGWDVYGGTD